MYLQVIQATPGRLVLTVSTDSGNIYEYNAESGKISKLMGFGPGNYGKALRGKAREDAEKLARMAYENRMPLVIAI